MIRNRTLIVVFALVSLCACDDIFEEDISDQKVTQIFPKANDAVESNLVPFQWTDLENVDSFRLQIALKNDLFVLDTLVNAINFDQNLNIAEYKWRVRGENFAYQTAFTEFVPFSVIAPTDLTEERIQLNSPADNVFLNTKTILCNWTKVEKANNYTFRLLKITNGAEALIFTEEKIMDTQFQIAPAQLETDGNYKWDVKGINTDNETETKEFSRVFNIDTQVPPKPQLSTPTADEEFNSGDEIEFTWAFNDTGEVQSAISSTIEIASDKDFSTIVKTENVTELSYNFTTTATGEFYWRVKGNDAAGNAGENSDIEIKFVVN